MLNAYLLSRAYHLTEAANRDVLAAHTYLQHLYRSLVYRLPTSPQRDLWAGIDPIQSTFVSLYVHVVKKLPIFLPCKFSFLLYSLKKVL